MTRLAGWSADRQRPGVTRRQIGPVAPSALWPGSSSVTVGCLHGQGAGSLQVWKGLVSQPLRSLLHGASEMQQPIAIWPSNLKDRLEGRWFSEALYHSTDPPIEHSTTFTSVRRSITLAPSNFINSVPLQSLITPFPTEHSLVPCTSLLPATFAITRNAMPREISKFLRRARRCPQTPLVSQFLQTTFLDGRYCQMHNP